MSKSLKELREITKNIDAKRKEFQKLQAEENLKKQWQLHAEASENKKKIQANLQSSAHIHLENIFSRIRFDYLGLSLLAMIIAGECFYLHVSGVISSPFQRGRYEVVVLTGESDNRNIAATVDNLMQELKSHKGNSSIAKLFNTGNKEKINSFMNETDSLNLTSVVYARNENCYYANALTDKDRNITFRLNRLEDDYKVSSIDIED